MKVIAVVPAMDEMAVIGPCLGALGSQTRPPDRVYVALDPSRDLTEALALAAGASVLRSKGNEHKKAGNLNQALNKLLPRLEDADMILVVDADSFLDPSFVENALRRFSALPGVAALGGTFRGRPEGSYLSYCQRVEYMRHAYDTAKLGGAALTLSGTAMMLRVSALREIQAVTGRVYTTDSLTEDLHLSCELMRMGYDVLAPQDLTLTTEVMPSLRALWRQRVRWRTGAVRTARRLGWGRGTRELSLRLAWGGVGIFATAGYLTSVAYGFAAGSLALYPLWALVTLIFCVEQAATVYRRGGAWRALVGSLLIFEMPYLLFLQAAHAAAYIRAIRPENGRW